MSVGERLDQLTRSVSALRHARRETIPGLELDAFGRRLGARLLLGGERGLGWQYLVNPVSILRYWEYAFVAQELPAGITRAADVSSPRLFSYWAAAHRPELHVDLLNPDATDTAASKTVGRRLPRARVTPIEAAADRLLEGGPYEAVWSISVLEHVAGPYDDTGAVRMIHDAVDSGGHILLTVPVDRHHRDEYREHDPYGTQTSNGGRYFFQRFYDEASLHARLIDQLDDVEVVSMGFFGERVAGTFAAYEREWMAQGLGRAVEDPREIADGYREFDRWSDMPGVGVCGLHLRRRSRTAAVPDYDPGTTHGA